MVLASSKPNNPGEVETFTLEADNDTEIINISKVGDMQNLHSASLEELETPRSEQSSV